MAIKNIFHCDYLTGGTDSTYLDYQDGNSLSNKDKAFVTNSGTLYVYELNATSGAAESSPTIISPDTNAGTKRWILIAIMADLTSVGGVFGKVTITQPANGSTLTIADGKTLTCTENTSLDEAVAMSSKAAKFRISKITIGGLTDATQVNLTMADIDQGEALAIETVDKDTPTGGTRFDISADGITITVKGMTKTATILLFGIIQYNGVAAYTVYPEAVVGGKLLFHLRDASTGDQINLCALANSVSIELRLVYRTSD